MLLRKMSILVSVVLVLGLAAQSFSYVVPGYTDYGTHVEYKYYSSLAGYGRTIWIGVDDGDLDNYSNFKWFGGSIDMSANINVTMLDAEHLPKLPGVQTPVDSLSNGGVEPTTMTDYVLRVGTCCSDYWGWMSFDYTGSGTPQDVGWSYDGGGTGNHDWSGTVGTGGGPVWGPTPEPATVMLLGLGGLALLRRKR